jgi:hypothetical protein
MEVRRRQKSLIGETVESYRKLPEVPNLVRVLETRRSRRGDELATDIDADIMDAPRCRDPRGGEKPAAATVAGTATRAPLVEPSRSAVFPRLQVGEERLVVGECATAPRPVEHDALCAFAVRSAGRTGSATDSATASVCCAPVTTGRAGGERGEVKYPESAGVAAAALAAIFASHTAILFLCLVGTRACQLVTGGFVQSMTRCAPFPQRKQSLV